MHSPFVYTLLLSILYKFFFLQAINARDRADEKQNVKTAMLCNILAVVTGMVSIAAVLAYASMNNKV